MFDEYDNRTHRTTHTSRAAERAQAIICTAGLLAALILANLIINYL